MAEVQEKIAGVKENVEEKLGGNTGNVALKAAAAAAATGAATYAVRRALGNDSHNGNGGNRSSFQRSRSSSLSSAAATGWDAAADVLIPFADDAAESAGKYVATHGPEILRERIVPKFIEAFNDAK
jgi:hypothetical protein